MLMDLSDTVYGKAAVQPTPMPGLPQPAVPPVAVPAYAATTDLLDAPDAWSWEQLRDYVVRAVAERHGPVPRTDPVKINSIFKSFATRWARLAGPIAHFAFEQQNGFWRSAPVTPNRFCKAADPYFADPIAQRLRGRDT